METHQTVVASTCRCLPPAEARAEPVPSSAFGGRAPKLVGSPKSAGAAGGQWAWKHRAAGHLQKCL